MKVDLYPGVGIDLGGAAELAQAVEGSGLGGLWALEAAREPFAPLAVAALATERVELRTAVAVALARNPMIMAQHAHELARVSGGRFVLGLGSQVRAHIERRFSESWSDRPVARMAEYVAALRAIWACWNDGVPLDFRGEFYQHSLMTPVFDPGPSGQPPPQVHLAAVGPAMIKMAAAQADGLVLHPMSSVRTIRERVLPLVSERLDGRDFELSCPVLVITGRDEVEMDRARDAVRKQLAFYASTPAYRSVLDSYEEAGLGLRLSAMAREGRWEEMTRLINDDLLHEFAVEAEPDDLADVLNDRFDGLLARVGLYAPYDMDFETWAEVASHS